MAQNSDGRPYIYAGGVAVSPDDRDGQADESFGAMFGYFIGGKIGDRFGRKKAVVFGSILALIGGALQAGSQNASMTICARTICGLGIGTINSVCTATPPSPPPHRATGITSYSYFSGGKVLLEGQELES